MMFTIQDNSFDSSFDSSRIHSSPEDNYIMATTPEPDDNDGATSADSDEDDDSESVVRNDESEVNDDASIASYDSDFPDEYIIHDHEATCTVPEALAIGPSSIDFPAISSALTKRIQEAYDNFPNLVKLEIAALVLLPENETIRVIWNHDAREWTYRGNDIPFVQFGFPGLRAVAKEFLHRAPCLYKKGYNLLVNYPTADFSLEYNRCGSHTEDDDEYLGAMRGAARIVRRHNNERPNQIIRSLTLSWCPRHDHPRAVLRYFRNIPGLEKVDLCTHAHYRRGTGFDSNLRDEEEASDQWHVQNSLNRYPIEIRMYNHWGVQLGVDEDEEEDEE